MRYNSCWMFACILIGTFIGISNGQQSINITTPELGTLIGSTNKTVWSSKLIYQYLGVRYAKPPSGENRFQPPILQMVWPGVHDVRSPGRPCTVLKYIEELSPKEREGDLEDCLHLSVYSKNLSASQPVMIYIHGGSFEEGAAYQHPPNYLLEKDIVLVVPQYRLGPFGFLSTQTSEISGNAGLLDVQEAISWVKLFVHNFGGDPNRITIFGQSAGAALASALLLSPSVANDTFQNMILQSGSATSVWAAESNPIQYAKDLAQLAGCPNVNDTQELNKCLKTIDVIKLLKAYDQKGVFPKLVFGGPYNSILPSSIDSLVQNYNATKRNITLVAGITKHDGSFILASYYDAMLKAANGNVSNINGKAFLNALLSASEVNDKSGALIGFIQKELFSQKQLVNGSFLAMMPGLMDVCSSLYMKAPVMKILQTHAKFYPQQSYIYSFDYRGEFTRFGYFQSTAHYPFDGGVHHSNDNIYLFPWPVFASKLNAEDTKVAKNMVYLWTSVAITGQPNANDALPLWPPFTQYSGPVMHIDKANKITEDFLDEYSVASREGRQNGQNVIHENATLICTSSIFLLLFFVNNFYDKF